MAATAAQRLAAGHFQAVDRMKPRLYADFSQTNCPCPTDPATEPEAIRKRQRRVIARECSRGWSVERVSDQTDIYPKVAAMRLAELGWPVTWENRPKVKPQRQTKKRKVSDDNGCRLAIVEYLKQRASATTGELMQSIGYAQATICDVLNRDTDTFRILSTERANNLVGRMSVWGLKEAAK